ncbi:MAG: hypothetical protein MJ072_04065, partial [Clostridia bacterium]|nr:hypothetical protein [Clostridia bacterium]
DGDKKWMFVAHGFLRECPEFSRPQNVTFSIRGNYTARLFDTVTGKIEKLPVEIKDGVTYFNRDVYDNDSLLVEFTPTDKTALTEKKAEKTEPTGKVVRNFGFIDYETEEDNVLLLDQAEYAVDGGEYRGFDAVMKSADKVKKELKFPTEYCQPYIIKYEKPTHTFTVRYTFYAEEVFTGLHLALEDADRSTVIFNGEQISTKTDGYYCDKAIEKIRLPENKTGKNELVITMPFGARDCIEPVYVLGKFGVRVNGYISTLVKKPEKVCFGDLIGQGFPFYGGNFIYKVKFDAETDGEYEVCVPSYVGALIDFSVDGKFIGKIAYKPYKINVKLTRGTHELVFKLFGTRMNTFGGLHINNSMDVWAGPASWFKEGEEYTYEYVLRPFGIQASPIISKK